MIKMDYETYNCTLETKSPVIVAAGSEYQYGPQEYIFTKKPLKDRKIDLIKRIDITKYYKSLDEDKKKELLKDLSKFDFKLEESLKFKKNAEKYSPYCSISECETKPKKEIIEHVKTRDKIYIPGSSIKGALSTAILYNKIKINDVKGVIKNKDTYDKILKKYFSSNEKNLTQSSIMRFIQITDTYTEKIIPIIYDIQLIQVKNIQSQKIKSNSKDECLKHDNNMTTYYEAIAPKYKLNCDITIKKDKEILNQLNLKEKGKILDIDYIKDVLYKFSMDYIEYEQNFIDTYNIDFLKDYYKQLAKENTPDSPLIRVGLGSGFMQTTINMKTKNEDPMLYKKVQKIAHKKSSDYEFPKSRKITAKTKKPLGWIKLRFDKK